MAPSVTTWTSPQEGTNVAVAETIVEHIVEASLGENSDAPEVKAFKDVYSQAFKDGYISGYSQPQLAKQIPIAIVGMSCRLPGNVSTPDEFWELCSRARSGWSEIPKERFDTASFYHPNPGKAGCFNAAGGNFLKEDVGLFDAPFFSLTAQEATSMDPQQRILLECTFEALESAGIPKHEIVGKDVGVFVGGSFSEYESGSFVDADSIPMYQATGCAFAMQSNRISHFFDLRGPSFTMDTACSSSLVALHQACQSLRNGECKSAIVGGCHLNMLPETWISMSNSRLFSDEGRSFSFDSRGTGYGRGEGCGLIVLKPLEQALKDNDNIRAVIRGSGINQDGKTPGITMPNGSAQESLMKWVYESAGIDPKDTGYVEAHGTGTKVGDPIEATALYNVFGEGRNARNPLFVGSVKSNIGHLEAASGIISVIKTAMMLERGFILPNHDFKTPNEKIPFSKWHLKVPVSQRPWPRHKRFASVNNFGFGGTNAHVVLERAPYINKIEPDSSEIALQGRRLIALSANDKSALEALMKNIGIYLERRPEFFQNGLMSNVAYTLGQRRSLLQWKVAIPATSSFELIQALNSGKVSPMREIEPLRIGFIFTGQGAQWNAMGRELYEHYPVFAASLDACDKCLVSFGAPFSLISELNKDATTSLVNEAHISQPACTAIQLALTDLLRSWNITPVAVAGHSSGEIGAAYAAGILPLDSCMAIAYYRGLATVELREKFPDLRGSMMAVGCSKEEIEPLIDQLSAKTARIACFNSLSSLTISGDEPAIDELQALMEEKQMFNRKLQVDVAYHSHHMSLVSKEYRNSLQSLALPKPTDVKFHSSLLGHLVEGPRLGAQYWVDNLTQAVRFSEAVTGMCAPTDGHKTGVNMLIELGPHSALAGPIKQIQKACGKDAMKIPYASALVRKKDAVETAIDLASTLFTKGATLDLGAINITPHLNPPTLLSDMPRYPWNHTTKYWHEPRLMQKHKSRTTQRHDLLGTLANYSNDLEPTWRNILRIDDIPWLRHHKIQSLTLFPMSAFIGIAVEAASQKAAFSNIQYDKFELRNVLVSKPLMLTEDPVEITLQLRPSAQDNSASYTWDEFKVHSWAANKGWTLHCEGFIGTKLDNHDLELGVKSTIEKITEAATSFINKSELYNSLSNIGVSYGPSFQGMNECHACEHASMAHVVVPDTKQEMPKEHQEDMIIHPALLEQVIEMYWPILDAGKNPMDTVYLPSSIGQMTMSREITKLVNNPGASLQAFCEGSFPSGHPKPTNVSMFAVEDESSKPLIIIRDLTVSPIVEMDLSSESDVHRELCYKLDWEPILQSSMPSEHSITSNGVSEVSNGMTNGITNGVDSHEYATEEIVIVRGNSDEQEALASKLADSLESLTGKRPEHGDLSEIETTEKLCLFISELDKPFLSNLSTTEFLALQKALIGSRGILWAVRGAYLNSSDPTTNMVTGLSRSIRSETMLKFATLDLDPDNANLGESTTKAILDVFKGVFGPEVNANCELEFMERKGVMLTPRIIHDTEMNEYVHKQTKASALELAPFGQEDRPLNMAISVPGAFETLHFIDTSPEESIEDDEIEVAVKAIGMNSLDLTAALGNTDRDGFGCECSGIVTRTGSHVTNFTKGDRVAGISVTGGVYSSHASMKVPLAFKINHDISFEVGASIPMVFCSAYYGLNDIGRLLPDDTILIHGGTSAFGQAAISLAQSMSARIFVTVGSIEKRDLLKDMYGLSENEIFVFHNTSFGPNTLQQTYKGDFDVVLNCISTDTDTLQEISACLSNFGRFINLGKQENHAKVESGTNRSYSSVDLISLGIERPKILSNLLSQISSFLTQGIIKPTSHTIFPISDIETAFKTLQSAKFDGKLIIAPKPEDLVKATPADKSSKILRPDATYILIGGTGGLGRSMARWMVSKGAKHLVLVSRSGSVTGKVKVLIDDLGTVGANIVVRRCDVANSDAVNNLITNELTGMPEVRGVIHGAMVLRDVLFEKMTYEEYTTVIESKVQGAWNFHNALQSQQLDFFVAISSAAGAVGNRGQAAYSAANTFLNAFVQYRLTKGLPASSLDLTAVSDAGYLAENLEAAAEVSKNLGSDTICEAEVLALLGAAIIGRLSSTCNNHTITGMRITDPPPFWTPDAKFKHLRLAHEALLSCPSSPSANISFNTALKNASTLEEAQEVVTRGLLHILPSVLMLEAEDMDVTRSLSNYALDSLVAIEVRNFIAREFEANLQVLELLSSGSIETLARGICGKSKLCSF
ncbi:BcPKS8, polyketide synthase [Sclerotinia borealis F-4128]|uniref:BcPKS8, polyketide synthase n=1 Tax=Sclerotinia borealis (strain F-4128) TaxID=1432307 RepID=W9CIN3_SCLBF|nr:BcPKS8, polyketide synthase [Sclerotinia borealis F-4128]